jgi:hypothetical protein
MFGNRCSVDNQDMTMVVLQIVAQCFEDKYLVLHVLEGRMKAGKFQCIKDNFLKWLSDWTENYMSLGAKEILVKSVLQTLPINAMGVFKFSIGLCDDLSHMIRNFWWGDDK